MCCQILVCYTFGLMKALKQSSQSQNLPLTLHTTLNRGIKGTKKLKGPFKQNCTYLDHDVQPAHTSITIDVHHRKIFI